MPDSVPPDLAKASTATIATSKKKVSWFSRGCVEAASIWKLPNGRYVALLEGPTRRPYDMPAGSTMILNRPADGVFRAVGKI